MKTLLLAVLLTLSACATISPAPPAPVADAVVIADKVQVTTPAGKALLEATPALVLANLTYQTIGTPVAVALESGVVPPAVAVQAKALSRQVVAALVAGEKAKTNAARAAEAAKALNLLATISRLTGVQLPRF